MNAVFYIRVRFLSRAVPFDCGLANWSCKSRSVKGEMFGIKIELLRMPGCNIVA